MNVRFLSAVVVLGFETERLCGQRNNADQFALLSYREASNKEAKSVDSVSPAASPRTAHN